MSLVDARSVAAASRRARIFGATRRATIPNNRHALWRAPRRASRARARRRAQNGLKPIDVVCNWGNRENKAAIEELLRPKRFAKSAQPAARKGGPTPEV